MGEFELNGRRYRELPDGKVQDIGPAASGGFVIPKSETRRSKESAEAQKAQADAASASAGVPYADNLAAANARAAAAEAALREQQAAAAALENANTAPPVTPEVRMARRALQGDNVLSALDDARKGIGWSTTGNLFGSGAFGHVPVLGQGTTDLKSALDTIRANLSFDRLTQMREESKTGGALGSVTERELDLLGSAVASINQSQSEEQLRKNLARVEQHYRRSMALMAGENPDQPEIAQKYGLALPQAPAPQTGGGNDGAAPGAPGAPGSGGGTPPSDPGETVLSADGRYADDPALAGVNATVARMYREGATAQEVRDYLNRIRPGLGGPQTKGIEEAVAWARQNPGKDLPVDLERVWEPASGAMQALGEAALWEDPWFGFSPGSALIGAGDMASFGLLDNLSAKPEMTRAVMTGVQERNPGSFLTGQVAGGVLSGLGAEAALARGGMGAVGRARGGDLLLGAGYGAGSADDPGDSRLANAAFGGLFGLGGGMTARAAMRGVGRGVAGVTDQARRRLADSNVRMSVGQLLGGGAQRLEDRLAGFPIIGDRIGAMRAEGISDFNRAAFNEGLAPIGATVGDAIGELGIDAAQDAVSRAYDDALGGYTVNVDPQFVQDLTQAVGNLRGIPRVGDEVVGSVDEMAQYFDPTGQLTGRNMQPLIRGLGQTARAYKNDPLGYRVAGGIGQVEDAVTGMFERQAPEVMPAFQNANEAFRNEEILRAAVNAARNGSRSKEPGVFMPSQLADAAASNSRRFGNSAGTTRQPFFELSRAGQEVLPSQVPDSGTAGRLSIPMLLSGGVGYANADEGEGLEGAGGGAALGAAGMALLAGPFASRTSRAVITRALLSDRNPSVRRLGEELIASDRIAGLLAAPLAVTGVQQ